MSIATGATLDLNGSSLTIGSLATSTGTITDNGAGGGTDNLVISGALTVTTGNGTLITNGATRSVAVYAGNNNSTLLLTNAANTFSGGFYMTGSARETITGLTVGAGTPVALTSGRARHGHCLYRSERL